MNLEKRINTELVISDLDYTRALFDLADFLYLDLKGMLKSEGRYFGIIPEYVRRLDLVFNQVGCENTDEDFETFGRVLYLFQPAIQSEYRRLLKKGLTEGDSLIVILNKLLKIIQESGNFPNQEGLIEVVEVFTKLFNNIKNRNKKDPMYSLFNAIRLLKSRGVVGKYSLSEFTLVKKDVDSSPIEGSGVRISRESSSKLTEVVWKDD